MIVKSGNELSVSVENVTSRTSNPFGMRAPCDPARTNGGSGETGRVVYGYGDANADFQFIGDTPNVHGGLETGVPFTKSTAGKRLQSVLHEVGFAAEAYADEPQLSNCFLSYRYMCPTPAGRPPTDAEYARLERYFDAELRAINAHILLPVGERPTAHVLEAYTTQAHKLDLDMEPLHAREIRGRGFMVVPIREPTEWTADDRTTLVETLTDVLGSDYRQTKGVATLVG